MKVGDDPQPCSSPGSVEFFSFPNAYSEPCQASKMELFMKIVNGFKKHHFRLLVPDCNASLRRLYIFEKLQIIGNLWFASVFRGYKMETLARNG